MDEHVTVGTNNITHIFIILFGDPMAQTVGLLSHYGPMDYTLDYTMDYTLDYTLD